MLVKWAYLQLLSLFLNSVYCKPRKEVAPPIPKPPPEKPPNISPCGPTTQNDSDGDGIDNNIELFVLGTNPNDCDTDDDGLPDSEAFSRLNPLNPDTDGDGVNDGDELKNGTNPYVADQKTPTSNITGTYIGKDDLGSPLQFTMYSDGTAEGIFRILNSWGMPEDIYLMGGLNTSGQLQLSSYDYYFVFFGDIGNSTSKGQLETADGAVIPWYTQRFRTRYKITRFKKAPVAKIDAYQPVRGKRKPTTNPVHQRVNWHNKTKK